MDHGSAFAPPIFAAWRRRENLVPGLVLAALAFVSWAYTFQLAGMNAGEPGEGGPFLALAVFLFGWTTMMVAMMLPATLPLILLYRAFTRRRLGRVRTWLPVTVLLLGYVTVWALAGVPVYAYQKIAPWAGSLALTLPGLLLVVAGVYQFTDLQRRCQARCSNPLSFLLQRWRPGTAEALRLGVSHGVDCLGCCAGLMAGLVALGMMNLAWMLTATVVLFVEKTMPGGHLLARPVGVLMVVGGALLFGNSLLTEVAA